MCGGKGTKYSQFLSFYVKIVIYVIKMVFFLNFVDNLLKDLTREQIGEKIQSRPWLNVRSKMIYNIQSTDK